MTMSSDQTSFANTNCQSATSWAWAAAAQYAALGAMAMHRKAWPPWRAAALWLETWRMPHSHPRRRIIFHPTVLFSRGFLARETPDNRKRRPPDIRWHHDSCRGPDISPVTFPSTQ